MKRRIDELSRKWWFSVPVFIFSQVFLPISFFSLAIPLVTFYHVVALLARWLRPDLGKPLSPESGLTTVDDFYTEPKHAVVGLHYTEKRVDKETVIRQMKDIVNEGRFPELAQKLTRFCLLWFWGKCSKFRVENHVREVLQVKTERDAQLYEEALLRLPFLEDQPLWDIHLFPNYTDSEGGSAFALRVHHALTDGVGHVALLDRIGGKKAVSFESKISFAQKMASLLKELFTVCRLYLRHYELTLAFLSDYNWNVWIKRENERSRKTHFAETYSLPLDIVKAAGKKVGYSGSEVIMAAFSIALKKEMERVGEEVPWSMSAIHPLPKAGHPGGLTNHAYLTSFVCPLAMCGNSRAQVLEEVRKEYKLKRETSPVTNCSIILFGILLQVIRHLPNVGPYCSLAVTNFALSKKPYSCFGSEVKRTSFVFDMSEHVPVVAMFIGYRDKMVLWIRGREDVFETEERPQNVLKFMEEEIRDMAERGLSEGEKLMEYNKNPDN